MVYWSFDDASRRKIWEVWKLLGNVRFNRIGKLIHAHPLMFQGTVYHSIGLTHASRADDIVIIGTAGHVDHGKTALVGTLTGMETDRLKEERERGLSIELGFRLLSTYQITRAPVSLMSPGTKSSSASMLSGAYGMDIVLFVVDAKEGVQEQTLEHLAISGPARNFQRHPRDDEIRLGNRLMNWLKRLK